MELYNQHTAAQDACYVSKYIPLDNPTFHLMTAIQHELHHNHQVNLSALQVPVWGHLTKYLQFGLLDSSFIWFRNISTIRSTFLQVPVCGHLTKYLQFGLLDSSFIWFRIIYNLQRNWATFMRS